MRNKKDFIYAPNVHLFAFQYQQALEANEREFQVKREWVKSQYQKILNHFFSLDLPFELRKEPPKDTDEFNLLPPEEQPILFFPKNSKTVQDTTIKAAIYPQQLNQTYALTFSVYCPQKEGKDGIQIEKLKDFNPKECLNIDTDLGQTILITAFLSQGVKSEERSNIARKCLQQFLHLSSLEESPPLLREGELFDSHIFEFGNPKKPNKYGSFKRYGRFLVLFYSNDSSSNLFRDYFYLELPSLFLYYHKIVQSFLDSRKDYQKAEKLAKQTSQILNVLQAQYILKQPNNKTDNPLSYRELKKLKQYLKELLNISVERAKIINQMENYLNTIEINTYNYNSQLKNLEASTNVNLSFWKLFREEECLIFQKQIESNLKYLQPKTALIEQNINTIRGLIEIDQAEHDRRLERTVQVVGTGLAVGAIVASSSPNSLRDSPPLPPFATSTLHPFFFSFLVSFSAAIIAGLIAGLVGGLLSRNK